MKNIILIGAGGHSKACIDVIESEKKYKIIGLINHKKINIFNYKTIGNDNDLKRIFRTVRYAHIAVGQIKDLKIREVIFKKLKKIGFSLPIIKSPNAYISKNSKIDEGTIIMHQAIINAASKIGKNCIINTKSIIEHDTEVKNNTHVAPGSIINGNCIIGKNCFLGSGSTIKENTTIKDFTFVKANSLVIKNK